MGSPLTHTSVLILGKYFQLDMLALFIGSQIPDIEGPIYYIYSLIKEKNFIKAYLNSGNGFLHSILGSILVNIPLTILLSAMILGSTSMTLVSAVIGVLSHLILDIPGHRNFTLFFPFIKKENPFLFKLRISFIERFYPWRKHERKKNQVMAEYSWWVFSHVFVIIAVLLYLA